MGGLIVIALFTALIAPYYIDWSSYKADFERETSRIIGQNVEVLGETKVRILPLPSVTFGGLAIGRNADGSPLMTVDQFAMDIELMPMLKGEVSIVELQLVRPRVNLMVDENGAIAWTNRHELAVNPEQIKLENFSVTNGELKVSGLAGGRTLTFEQLDGQISAKSLYGPWRINADGYVGTKRARIAISTGHLQDDGSIRIRLNARQADLPYKLGLDGVVKVENDVLRWAGDYEITAQKSESPRVQPLPIFLQGKFDATPRNVKIPEFRLEIGSRDDPYTITGNGSAHIGERVEFQIVADGRQIDLDRVANVAPEDDEGQHLALNDRLGVLRKIVEKIPVPDADGTIDLSLPAIVAGDTVIREISTVFSPDKGGWEIRKLNAIFPGNTQFEARGKVGLGKAYGFTGNMLVASRQPTGLAAWLGKRNNPFIRKLRTAGFSAEVVISENQTSFENLELVLDKAVLKGKLQRLGGGSGRAAIIARLEGKKINLDNLRAISALIADENSQVISSHDLDINLEAAKLTGFDIYAEDVEARFRVFGGTVSIEKLSASSFFGSRISSTGRIDNLLKQPNGNFKLKLQSPDASALLAYLKSVLPSEYPGSDILANLVASPELLKDLDLDFSINSRARSEGGQGVSKGLATLRGTIGGTDLDVVTDFEGRPEQLKESLVDVSVKLSNDNPVHLLQQLNVEVVPIDIGGSMKLSANFNGKAQSGFESFFDIAMAGSTLNASGMLFPASSRTGPLKVTFASGDMAPLLLLSGYGSGAPGQARLPASFSGLVSTKGNQLRIENGEGQIDGNEFVVDLVFDNHKSSNKRIQGKLKIAELDLPFISKLSLNNGVIAGQGRGTKWSNSNFGPAVLLGVDGDISFNAERVNIGLANPAEAVSGTLALVDGSINLNDLKGRWLDGRFEANMSFTNAEGIGSMGAQVQIENIDGGRVGDEFGLPHFFNSRADIVGNVEGSGRSIEAIVSALVGSGTVELNDVVIAKLNPSPLTAVFEAADREGFQILDENVLPVISRVIDQGVLEAGSISIPLIISAGKIRARNILFEAQKTRMAGAFELNIATGGVNSELSVRFDAGEEWVEGAEPQIIMSWKGDLEKPVRMIDVQPLSGFLSLRNFEREQRRVDLLQASILEKQRLRRDVVVTNARVRYRQRLRDEELRRQRQAFLAREEARLRKIAYERHLELLKKQREQRAAAKRAAEAERKRLAAIEAERLARIERERLAEEARQAALAEEKRKAALAEQLRLEEEARKAAALKRQRDEIARRAAQERLAAEEQRRAAELERTRIEEAQQPDLQPAPVQVAPDNNNTGNSTQNINGGDNTGTIVRSSRKPQLLNDSNFAKRLNEFLSEN